LKPVQPAGFSLVMPFRNISVVALTLLLLAGCTTPPPAGGVPPAPASTGRAPAVPVQAEMPPASIRGSQETSTLLDNFTVFLTAVDGQAVAAGRKGWDQPLPLKPGRHRLAVEFNRGIFLARAELQLDATPGAAYELRQASDAQVYGSHSYCEFWIVDLATGEKATAVQRTGLSSAKPGG
jgi:hypothetical protein